MPNTLKIKRGAAASIPQGQLAEPLFTTDTYDLYIGKGSGGNQRIQNYIASGTSSQFLKGDGTLDSTTYQATSEKGQNNGYASLDAGGKIPAAQLPSSVIEYKGTWNASTNTPTLADGTGDAGDVYIVSVGGTQNLGSGSITFDAGDWVMYNGSVWQKSTGSNAVASVNGQTGVVTITFDQLSPMTTLGDTIYGAASGAGTRLAGNITVTKKFLSQTGTGTASAAPSWQTVTQSDVGLSNVENTALSTWAGSANITTLGTITSGTWNGTTIAIANGGTGQTTKAAAFNALSPMTTLGDIIYGGASGAGTRLAGNTAASKRFLIQTGDGTISAAPSWGSIAAGDVPDLSATYLPLAGGTLTGGLSGTTGTFSGVVQASAIKLTDMTAGSGALYYNTTAKRLTLANYNADGILVFEVNGGNYAMYLNADLTMRLPGYTTNGILKFGNSDGTIGVAVAGDFPTLNQNTTGSAATLTTARTLTIGATGRTFDGSTDRTWTLADIGAEPTLTKGNLTETTSSVLTITGGTGAVIGSGTTIEVKNAGLTQNGVVTTGAQTLAGAKTLTDLLTGTRVAMTASITSGAANSFAVTQTQRNGTDTGDIAMSVSHTITASSASNQLVIRAMSFGTNNNLTGGGAVTNYRGWNIASSTQTGTTTTHLDQIYIERGTADGTVTNNRAIRINNMQGTNRAAFFVLDIGDGGTNNSYMVLGSDASATIPTGNWGIYQIQSTYNNYFNGKLLVKTTTDAGYALDVNGTARLTGALSGTSATFSSSVTANQLIANNSAPQLDLVLNVNTAYKHSIVGTNYSSNPISANQLDFKVANGSNSQVTALSLFGSGAATFSGNVNITVDDTPQLLLTHSNTSKTFLMAVDGSNAFFRANSTNNILFQYAGGTNALSISGSTGAASFSSSVTASVASGNGAFYINNASLTNKNWTFLPNTNGTESDLLLYYTGTGAGTKLTITNSGNVGIGTTNPTNKLNVIGSQTGTQITTIPIGKFVNTGNEFSKFIIGSDNANYDGVISMDNNATLANTKLRFYIGNGTNSTAGHSNDQIVLQGNGNVGIGTASPVSLLHLWGAKPSVTSTDNGVLNIDDNTAQAAGVGGSIVFGGKYRALGDRVGAAAIEASKVNGTDGNYAFDMLFYSRPNGGSLSERMRITSGGNLLIATTTASYSDTGRGNITIGGSTTSLLAFQVGGVDKGYIYHTGTDIDFINAANGYLRFGTNNTERMRITSGGELLINTTTDSGAYYLQVNGSVYATAYYESSDITLKDVLTNSYSENFSAIEFMWKDKRDEKKHWGYAAQDVMKYIPDAIEVNKDGMMTVNYNEAHTWKIAQLEKEILELKAKING